MTCHMNFLTYAHPNLSFSSSLLSRLSPFLLLPSPRSFCFPLPVPSASLSPFLLLPSPRSFCFPLPVPSASLSPRWRSSWRLSLNEILHCVDCEAELQRIRWWCHCTVGACLVCWCILVCTSCVLQLYIQYVYVYCTYNVLSCIAVPVLQ